MVRKMTVPPIQPPVIKTSSPIKNGTTDLTGIILELLCGIIKEHGGLIVAGYVCGFLSFSLVLFPALGIVAFVCGVILMTKGRIGHGIAIVIISVTCGSFGAIRSLAAILQFLG